MPHTPGPWKVEFLGEDKNIVIHTEQNPEGILNVYPIKEAKANAALIAAAPELLKVLKKALIEVQAFEKRTGIPQFAGWIAEARIAIAAATTTIEEQ